ncbi:hypothetical protein C0Q70_21427 [Pomacea canaliculata]|uniref:Medium-chain acyl-CoA ligase ACSF2, mitochondrial n=1 Tax=Pomacea canaliculata TaxID=400727 RepID=A0A2T7NCG9_POMCA|nr:hypothetical protein C0Q70_21427 [Pomacea canaliculata]
MIHIVLKHICIRTASWLRQQNVCKSDVVLCLVPTSPEQTLITFGTELLGATIICSCIQYKDGADIVPLMKLGDVTALVVDETDQQAVSTLEKLIPNLCPGPVTSPAIPSLKTVIFCKRFSDEDTLTFLESVINEEEADLVDLSADEITIIFTTSGTSGQTKLLPISHRCILKSGLYICEVKGWEEGEVIFNPCSLRWTVGYPGDYLVAGHTRVVPYVKQQSPVVRHTPEELHQSLRSRQSLSEISRQDRRQSTAVQRPGYQPLTTVSGEAGIFPGISSPPKDEEKFVFNLLKEERVIQAYVTPAFLKAMLARADLLEPDDRWRGRSIITAGSVVTKDMIGAWKTLASELRVVYGSTEMGSVTCKIYRGDDEVEEANCGKPAKGRRVKVVDEALREVPPNTRGELLIDSTGWFPGYLKQPQLTAQATPEEGWFRPGDVAYINEHGDVFVEGRCSDVIRSSPQAQRLLPDNLLRYCAEYYQEGFRQEHKEQESTCPKFCLLFNKFPVNANGKLLRRELRHLALERLGINKDS